MNGIRSVLKFRLRHMLAILFLLVAIPTSLSIFGLFATYHATSLQQIGAEVSYGVKGGYFVTPHDNVELATFLHNGRASLDYLSRKYQMTLRLNGRELTDDDLRKLASIRGSFNLSLRNTIIDEQSLETLIAIPNLQSVDATNTTISENWLARFNETRSQ